MARMSTFPECIGFAKLGEDYEDLVNYKTIDINMAKVDDDIWIILKGVYIEIPTKACTKTFHIPAKDLKIMEADSGDFFEYIGNDDQLLAAVKENYDYLLKNGGGELL